MSGRKVIIADDEQHIRHLINGLIEWEEYGLEVVGFAHDGDSALEMCERILPDFLITDIRMPGVNGIDLIKELYDKLPDIKVIIITGYSYFSYARQALRYNVVDYLLKPIQKDELIQALQKGISSIDREAIQGKKTDNFTLKSMQKIKDNLLLMILRGGSHSDSIVNQDLLTKEYHFRFTGRAWRLIQIEFMLNNEENTVSVHDFLKGKMKGLIQELLQNSGTEILTTFEGNSFFCMLNGECEVLENLDDVLIRIKHRLLMVNDVLQKICFTIGVSSICDNFSHIHDCVKECQLCMEYKILKGANKTIFYTDIPTIKRISEEVLFDNNTQRKLLEAVTHADGGEIERIIDQLITVLYRHSRQIDGHIVINIYKMLTELFFKGMAVFDFTDYGEFSLEFLLSQGDCFFSISAAFSYLNDVFQVLLRYSREEKKNYNLKSVKIAQLYVNEHFREPVTLEEIAKHVGLNDTYLSSIFKKQIGKSLIDYLTEVRVHRAKELLMNSDLNISEIAEQVGFNDAKYFTKRFKKFTGVSPNEYRKLFS